MPRASTFISDRSGRKELNEKKKKIQNTQKKENQKYDESYFSLYIDTCLYIYIYMYISIDLKESSIPSDSTRNVQLVALS